jgi:hypothetical protein
LPSFWNNAAISHLKQVCIKVWSGQTSSAQRFSRAMLANGLDLSLVAKLTGLAPSALAREQPWKGRRIPLAAPIVRVPL